MKKSVGVSLAAMLMSSFVVLSGGSAEGGPVTETKPTCQSASAILLGSQGGDVDRIKAHIAETRTPIEVSIVSWELTHPRGKQTEVYGVKCKSGADCNAFAKAFASFNQDSSPMVFCGDTVMLKNEQAR